MRDELLRFDGAVEREGAIDAWLDGRGELGEIARVWFEAMRGCGDEVRELLHDGCPTACLGDVPFGYVNVGFFQGAGLADPAGMLEGAGKRMRHVKLRPGVAVDEAALRELVEAAWRDIRARVEQG